MELYNKIIQDQLKIGEGSIRKLKILLGWASPKVSFLVNNVAGIRKYFQEIKEKEGYVIYRVTPFKLKTEGGRESGENYYLLVPSEKFQPVIAFGVGGSASFQKFISILKKLYPTFQILRFRERDLWNILEKMKKMSEELRVVRIVGMRYFGKKPETSISYLKGGSSFLGKGLTLDEAREKLRLAKLWMHRATCTLQTPHGGIKYSIGRDGIISIIRSDGWEILRSYVLNSIYLYIIAKPRPRRISRVVVKLDKNVFEDREGIENFIQFVRKNLPRWGVSPIVISNPYAILEVYDYQTGDSYSLMLYKGNEIHINGINTRSILSSYHLLASLLEGLEGEVLYGQPG